VLLVRGILKRIGQLSWNISQIDRRYPIEDVSEEQVQELLDAYLRLGKDISKVLSEIQHELEAADTE
jgi:hypothetical protein